MAYMPSPWQKSMHARAEPRKWIWVGRRGGKGRAVLHEALSVINTASFSPCIHDGLDMTDSLTPQIHVWCVAPNYGQAQQQAQQQFTGQMGRYGQAAQQMAGLGGQQQQHHAKAQRQG